jgi:DNA polymerase III delta prime subunit
MSAEYKAWFEKYRPRTIEEVVFPNEDIEKTIKDYYDQGFINGNILSYGPPGFGKTTVSEVLIHKIIKNPNDLFILGRKTDDVDNLKRWLQQRPVHSSQKIVKIEEMDRLSNQAQIVLKDGLMEKYQANTAFLATTNSPEKIDPALITRFNTRINFGELPPEKVAERARYILEREEVNYHGEELQNFVNKYYKRGLRDLINNLELATSGSTFYPDKIDSFVGISGNEDLVVQYITYLVKYADSLPTEKLKGIIKDAKSDQQFFTYYEYMLTMFKNELRLNYHAIFKELFESDLDMSAKNIVENYWQDLELKRFKGTHTIALLHELLLNSLEQKG